MLTYRVDVRDTASGAVAHRTTDWVARQLGGPRPVLGAFSMAGFPDYHRGVEALVAYADSGATVLEVGTPAVNPWLDGPAIAVTHRSAIRAGHSVDTTVATVDQVAALTGKAVVMMSYWATVAACGPRRMARELASAGVPNVPGGCVAGWMAAAADAGIGALSWSAVRRRPPS